MHAAQSANPMHSQLKVFTMREPAKKGTRRRRLGYGAVSAAIVTVAGEFMELMREAYETAPDISVRILTAPAGCGRTSLREARAEQLASIDAGRDR